MVISFVKVKPSIVVGKSPTNQQFSYHYYSLRRRDCAVDDTCVLCYRCFHATSHEGHSFYRMVAVDVVIVVMTKLGKLI